MIYIGGDTHGYKAIAIVETYLKSHTLAYENLGVVDTDSDMKLEELIPLVVNRVLERDTNLGILACGTGVGVAVGANRFSGIRACLATTEKIAEWSKVYDKCNVLCLSGWETTKELIFKILDTWFSFYYDGDADRLKMFKAFDTWH